MCGTSLFGGRVVDALQCLGYVSSRPDVDANKLFAIGWGQGELIALTASALDERIAGCAAIGSLSTYRCLVDADHFAHPPSTFVWDVLADYHIPEAAACVAPRRLLLASPVDAMCVRLAESELRRAYQATAAAYRACHGGSSLTTTTDEVGVLDWLMSETSKVRRVE